MAEVSCERDVVSIVVIDHCLNSNDAYFNMNSELFVWKSNRFNPRVSATTSSKIILAYSPSLVNSSSLMHVLAKRSRHIIAAKRQRIQFPVPAS